MAPMPASKANVYAAELDQRFEGPPNDFRLRQILRDCRNAIGAVRTNEERSVFNNLAGSTCFYLGLFNDALAYFNAVVAIGPGSAFDHTNVATTLVSLGRERDALDRLMKIKDPNMAAMVCFADALSRLGQVDDARAAFEDAVEMAKSAIDHFWVAVTAADMGHDVEACEMFARALSLELREPMTRDARAIDFIRDAPSRLKGCLRYRGASGLCLSIAKMEKDGDRLLAWHRILTNLPHGGTPTQEAMASSMEVFESMKPYRMRASATAIGADDDGSV